MTKIIVHQLHAHEDITPCFGFGGCDVHKSCARYHAIETSDSLMRYGHCPVDANGKRTLFVAVVAKPIPIRERRDVKTIELREAA